MIVQRNTLKVKSGAVQELMEIWRGEVAAMRAENGYSGAVRASGCWFGERGRLALEYEFENLAALDEFWAAWGAKPTTAQVMERWRELTREGEVSEVWTVLE